MMTADEFYDQAKLRLAGHTGSADESWRVEKYILNATMVPRKPFAPLNGYVKQLNVNYRG